MKIKESRGDRIFYGFVYFMILFLSAVCIYPLWLVIVNSISDPHYVSLGQVWLLPKGFGFDAYKEAFADERILSGYWQTILQTLVGTAVNMALTIPAAYALSKKDMKGRSFFMTMIVITMYFGGGLIPSFINVSNLKLLNNWWVIPLIGAVASYNLIVARTFFASGVPHELEEAAEIDGCSVPGTFFKIVLPLSKAMLGVIMLYYVVGHWNNFTACLYYTPAKPEYWSLQMVLRDMMQQITNAMAMENQELMDYYAKLVDQIKYAVIVIAAVPVLILYPFLQKYFDKGVMLGSVKG